MLQSLIIFMYYDVGLMLRSKEIGAAAEAWPVGLLGLVWPWIS